MHKKIAREHSRQKEKWTEIKSNLNKKLSLTSKRAFKGTSIKIENEHPEGAKISAQQMGENDYLMDTIRSSSPRNNNNCHRRINVEHRLLAMSAQRLNYETHVR